METIKKTLNCVEKNIKKQKKIPIKCLEQMLDDSDDEEKSIFGYDVCDINPNNIICNAPMGPIQKSLK